MELEFGYNCKYFLPTLGKCRKLIDSRRDRKDLAEQRWLSAQDLLVYRNTSNEELVRQITSGEIKAKVQNDGKVTFGVSAPWQYDDCFLANGGGACLYFEPHQGKAISCLAELKGLAAGHPNYSSVPSEADVRAFEDRVLKILGTP